MSLKRYFNMGPPPSKKKKLTFEQNEEKYDAIPAWYWRVRALADRENRPVEGEDFDDDISLIDEDRDKGKIDLDFISDDSLAVDYEDLQLARRQRKFQCQKQADLTRRRRVEKAKLKPVKQAYKELKDAVKRGEQPPKIDIRDAYFDLFCEPHVEHFYINELGEDYEDIPKYLQFEKLFRTTAAEVFFTGDRDCEHTINPFQAPMQASTNSVKLDVDGTRQKLSFKFISNDFLRMKVSRELVFKDRYHRNPPAPGSPKFFYFYGIRRDLEQERREREEEQQRLLKKRRRSTSPRETWFEMNHPMGSWKQENGGLSPDFADFESEEDFW